MTGPRGPYKKPKTVTVFRVLPRVVHVQVDVAPSADVMVAAEAIQVLLMSYVSTNQMAVSRRWTFARPSSRRCKMPRASTGRTCRTTNAT